MGRSPAPLEAWLREARLALRRMRREPGYAATAVGTLALGIAGVTGVGLMAASVLSPLPYPRPDELVAVWETRAGRQRWVAPANYLDWRRSSETFAGLAAHEVRTVSVTIGDESTRERVAAVSGNYFAVLGVEPRMGRSFDPALDTSFPERVAVLSASARDRAFGDEADALGRTFLIDGEPYEVVGVMDAGFAHPEPGLFAWLRSPAEVPDAPGFRGDLTQLRDAWYFEVTGRLAPGTSIDAARAEMASISVGLERTHPDTNAGSGVQLLPLLDQTVGGFDRVLAALALAVGLILVASMANLVHLTLARAETRRTLAAIRVSLGASRADIRRGLLVEGCLVGLLGGMLGVGLAGWGVEATLRRMGDVIPRAAEVGLTGAQAGLGVALGFGLGALLASITWLRSGLGRNIRSSLTVRRSGTALVAVQVALSIAVASSALLLSTSFVRLGRVEPGFQTEGLSTFRLSIPDARSRGYVERLGEYRSVADAVRSIPGVAVVGLGSDTPLHMGRRAGVFLADAPRPDHDPPDAGWQPVDPDYFSAMGMKIVSGRGFTVADGADGDDVAVVNEAFVRSVLGTLDPSAASEPLGAHVTMGLDGHDRPLRIVGVVANTRTRGPATQPGAVLYRPVEQTSRFDARSMLVAVRAATPEQPDLTATVREVARRVAPGLPYYDEAAGREMIEPFRASQAMLMAIMTVFAMSALSIAVVGMYGVALHAVRRRRRDIAIRMALGATAERVTGEVLRSGLGAALWGVVPGLLLAMAVGRSFASLLFGISASDPRAPGAVAVLVLCLAASAFLGPARLAAKTEPARVTADG